MTKLLLAGDNPLFGVCPDGRGIYIFGLEIYYYALCIVAGMIVAAVLSALLMRRRNMSPDFIYLLFLVCIPSAVIGARLFSYLTTSGSRSFFNMTDDSIMGFFEFRDGGLSITGGIIGGVGSGYLVCLIKKVDFFRAADCVVINMLLAQAMGRWGNFFNAEVYGGVVNPGQEWFPFAVPISDLRDYFGVKSFSDPTATWHYAFFFYEMLFNLIGWALLFTFTWYRKKKPNGLSVCLYLVWYGTVRTIMEPLRDPGYILDRGGVPWSHLFSILMVGLGIIGCMLLMIFNFKKEGAFIGSKKGDPCGITNYLTPYKDDPPYYSKINMFGANYPPRPPKKKGKAKKGTEAPPDTENQNDQDGEHKE